MTIEGQCNHDLALSLSKGGRGLQACFDKLSTGLQGWVSEGSTACTRGSILGLTVSALSPLALETIADITAMGLPRKWSKSPLTSSAE
jgi:hypothetical protein